MVRCRSRFGLICLGRAVASASMPFAGVFRSMFEMHGADAEGYEEYAPVQAEGNYDGAERSIIQRNFVLNDEHYSVFNTLGQERFKILQQQGLDSACWRHAATSIDADCATMPHARKQRLAVQLSNCHLQDAGRKGTRCSPKDSDERCVKELQNNDVAFESFTTFFHHVNAICYHLSHTVWQEQTEGLVRGLTASSLATFDRAEQSLVKQELVLEGQERASVQTQGIADGLTKTSETLAGLSDNLSQELVSAIKEIEKQEVLLASLMANQAVAATQASSFSAELGSAKSELASYMQAIEEDRRVAKDQNLDLMKTIDFIHDCLDNASSAWARFQAFTYLILAANLCWVLTTALPLRSARTSLFALVAFGLMLEKSLCSDGGLERPVAVDWIVTGLKMSPETPLVATWAKIFNQEKIRWLTFQAGAVILGHALASFYLPFLEIGRLVGWLRRKCGFGESNTDIQATSRQQQRRLLSGGGREREGDGGGSASRENTKGRRGSSDSMIGRGGAPAGRGRRNAGTRGPPLSSINHVGEESGNDGDESDHNNTSGDSDALGVGEGQSYGGSCCGSNRAWAREDTRADGLERLSRQELQSLAKATNGAVRANASTGEIVKGLRGLCITANA